MSHVLLVANRTCPCPDVLEEVRTRPGSRAACSSSPRR